MFLRKIIILFTTSILLGQSIHHAYGLGTFQLDNDASSSGISSRGLVPSFYRGISLTNPVTWNKMEYALLSGNYNGNEVESSDGINGISGVVNAQFSVPMGKDFAWGFGIKPVFNQQYLITDDPFTQYIDDDTLTIQRSVDGSGGVTSLYSSFNFPITTNEHMAIEWNVLFGSLRKNSKFNIDQSTYHFFQRQMYSGTYYRLFLSTDRFYSSKMPLNIYLMTSSSMNPMKVTQYSFQPFEDINKNGFYDGSDVPSPVDIPSAEVDIYKEVFDPKELGVGFDYKYKENTFFTLELHRWKDEGFKYSELYPLRSLYVTQSDQLSFGLIRYANEIAFRLPQKLQYRGGFYFKKETLLDHAKNVNEIGFSLGIGIKFGVTNNQIDVAYKYGIRSGDPMWEETIQQLTIGFQLGDRWFVKRRPK